MRDPCGVSGGERPILAGLSTNTTTRVILAAVSGDRRFFRAIVPGLLAVIAAAWAGARLF